MYAFHEHIIIRLIFEYLKCRLCLGIVKNSILNTYAHVVLVLHCYFTIFQVLSEL